VKKKIEERKENIEPFTTSITQAKDNEPEVLNIVKESGVKVMLYTYIGTTIIYSR